MGYDLNRFTDNVDEELICPVCTGVLDEPLQVPSCEHAFCKACILQWLMHQMRCPVDRQSVNPAELRQVPRILRNLLSRLRICCDNKVYGCQAVVRLEGLNSHLNECEHNPKKPIPCDQGCGFVIPMDELKDHNCVRELRNSVQQQKQKISDLMQQVNDQRFQISDLKTELHFIKECMKALNVTNPAVRAIASEIARDEILQWSNTLTRARVTRWGGIISTPDDLLQISIREALIETGCPNHILDALIDHCHEENWPRGLSSLEMRQSNRRHYEHYVCKRIPGKQAVVVLHVDNTFVKEDMITQPGLVMIFAHGIE